MQDLDNPLTWWRRKPGVVLFTGHQRILKVLGSWQLYNNRCGLPMVVGWATPVYCCVQLAWVLDV